MIVTNPGGEEYIIGREKFEMRCEPSGEQGVYNAKGFIRAIRKPFAGPLAIMASWNKTQYSDENCMFQLYVINLVILLRWSLILLK